MLVAAHELKAPLSLMRQLALAIDSADETTCQRYRSQLINVSERALRQVNDLVKIARLEDGFFETEPVSVRGVCEAVLSELSPFFRIEGRSIDLEFHNKSRLAVANHDLLYSIVYNFCVNAIHYSERGSVSEMVISERRSRLRISVRDYGPALPTKVWRELNVLVALVSDSILLRNSLPICAPRSVPCVTAMVPVFTLTSPSPNRLVLIFRKELYEFSLCN